MKKISLWMLSLTLLAGCGGETDTTDTTSETQNTVTIGVMPKLIGIDYFNACEQGAKEAGQELGVNVVYDGPTTDDVAKQTEMIDSWITRKFNAICVAPNDKEAIGPSLAKAKDRGIHAITWDADGAGRDYYVNMAKGESLTHTLVDLLAESCGSQGEFAIITGRLTAANQNMWIQFIRDYVAQKYPGLKEVDLKTSEENQQMAFQVTGDLLKTYPNLKGILAITSVALPGAAQAVEEAKAYDRVFVTGFSSPNSMKQYVQRGVIKKFVLWSPVDLGYLTVQVAHRLINNQPIENGFEAGRLGKITVEGTEVILGDPLVFDASNIDQYNF